MNTHLVKRTIAAATVAAAALTGAAGFAAASPAEQTQVGTTQTQVNPDHWAQELVSTFTARYAKALKAGDIKEVVHLRNSYFVKHAELILQETAAMDGQDPIFKNYGLPVTEWFKITASNPQTITIKYTARMTDHKLHEWNYQVDQEAALIKHVQLA